MDKLITCNGNDHQFFFDEGDTPVGKICACGHCECVEAVCHVCGKDGYRYAGEHCTLPVKVDIALNTKILCGRVYTDEEIKRKAKMVKKAMARVDSWPSLRTRIDIYDPPQMCGYQHNLGGWVLPLLASKMLYLPRRRVEEAD